jgi:hypothetical protein
VDFSTPIPPQSSLGSFTASLHSLNPRDLKGVMRVGNQNQRLFLFFAVTGVYLRTMWPEQPALNQWIGILFILLLAPFLANAMLFGRRFRR